MCNIIYTANLNEMIIYNFFEITVLSLNDVLKELFTANSILKLKTHQSFHFRMVSQTKFP